MDRKRLWAFMALVFIAGTVHSAEFFVAPIFLFSDGPGVGLDERDRRLNADLMNRLDEIDTSGLLAFRAVDEDLVDAAPRSLVEVSRLAETLGMRFVLYGIVRKTDAFYDAQLRIFDNEVKDDMAVFYARSGLDAYERIPNGLAEQAAQFTRSFLGLSEEQQAARRQFGGVMTRLGGGYWMPTGEWSERTRGIATGTLGVRLIPLTPLVWRQTWEFALRMGIETVYQVGEEVPGLISGQMSTFTIDLPVDGCWQVHGAHSICVGTAPSLRIDAVQLEPLFEDEQTEVTTAVGAVFRTGYEYWFGVARRLALGIEISASGYAYDPALFSTGARMYTAIRFPPVNRTDGEHE